MIKNPLRNWIGWVDPKLGRFVTKQKYLSSLNGLPYSADVKPTVKKNQCEFIKCSLYVYTMISMIYIIHAGRPYRNQRNLEEFSSFFSCTQSFDNLLTNGPTPASFSFIFGLSKQTIPFLQKINVKKCPNVHPVYGTRIQTHDLSNMSCRP